MKQIAFDVTPDWWGTAPNTAKQLVVAAAGALLPQRLPGTGSVFAVGDSVFAYDILVAENAPLEELNALRIRIVAELETVRALLPSAWTDGADVRELRDPREGRDSREPIASPMRLDDSL